MLSMLRTCSLQIPSGYYIQTMNSNLHLDDLLLPIGIMNVISILPLLLLAPLIECVTACFLSMGKTPVAPAKVISESIFMHTPTNINRILMSSPGYYCILCSYVSFILPVSSPSFSFRSPLSYYPSLYVLPLQLWAMCVPLCRSWWQVCLSCAGSLTL